MARVGTTRPDGSPIHPSAIGASFRPLCLSQHMSRQSVTCSIDGHVTELRLAKNGLVGQIPASLSDLTFLRVLSLAAHPKMTGTLPPSLGSLSNLEGLTLSSCSLSGTIPATFGSLSRLDLLELSGNLFTGTVP